VALQTLEGHSRPVMAVAFSPDGKLLASASGGNWTSDDNRTSDDSIVRLWNPATGATLQTLEGHGGAATAIAFSPDSKLLASALDNGWTSDDNAVRLWDLATGATLQTLEVHASVDRISFSEAGEYLETDKGILGI
jgi:WD40 repeat protein